MESWWELQIGFTLKEIQTLSINQTQSLLFGGQRESVENMPTILCDKLMSISITYNVIDHTCVSISIIDVELAGNTGSMLKLQYHSLEHRVHHSSISKERWYEVGDGLGHLKADELGVDAYVEATKTGRLLYEKYGFMTYYKVVVNTSIENSCATWTDLETKLPPEPQ